MISTPKTSLDIFPVDVIADAMKPLEPGRRSSTQRGDEVGIAGCLGAEPAGLHIVANEESLDRIDNIFGSGKVHSALDTSANADIASGIFSESCNRRSRALSVFADTMLASDPIALIDRLLAVKPAGLSANAWAGRAGVSRNVFTDIRRRNAANHSTIEKLLDAIGITFAEFEAGVVQPEKEPPSSAMRAPRMAFQAQDRPRDVPVVGTAECADLKMTDDGNEIVIEAMTMDLDEIVDHVRRPVSLDNRRDVYAIYYVGHSMAPRYESGELAYVDPKRPPSIMDYVVLQLREPDGSDGERIYKAMAKRLVRQSADFYELEQFNPPMRFRIERSRVAHCHRIIPWGELVAF